MDMGQAIYHKRLLPQPVHLPIIKMSGVVLVLQVAEVTAVATARPAPAALVVVVPVVTRQTAVAVPGVQQVKQ